MDWACLENAQKQNYKQNKNWQPKRIQSKRKQKAMWRDAAMCEA